jgi:glyoxylase-like metal-dependent hydrolase (beta-lactamase superfamily II)
MGMNRRTFLTIPTAVAATSLAGTALGGFPQGSVVQRSGPIDFKRNLPATGSFPKRWICGSASAWTTPIRRCRSTGTNEHTAILRQNKAYSYEAPFAPLYFGNERVLLLDEGFLQLRSDWDLRAVVDSCIEDWCRRNGRAPASLELLVAFSHLHADHYAAVNQFADRPNTRYMGLTHEEMVGFWGMTNFPEERVTLDLGGRDILIWGSPGHVVSEFAHYDSYTQILYTGDMFYRGRCYISFWQPWFDSMRRLIDFCDTHPVTHVMGCHVEISKDGARLSVWGHSSARRSPGRDDGSATARRLRDGQDDHRAWHLLHRHRVPLQPDARHHDDRQEPVPLLTD